LYFGFSSPPNDAEEIKKKAITNGNLRARILTLPFDISGIAGAVKTDVLREDDHAKQMKKLTFSIEAQPSLLDGGFIPSTKLFTQSLDLFLP
jgi:hypothetical protein